MSALKEWIDQIDSLLSNKFPLLFHIICPSVAGSIAIAIFTDNGFGIFPFHPTFMAISFLVFLSEAVCIYKLPGLNDEWSHKRSVHRALQFAVLGGAILGSMSILAAKNHARQPLTPHSVHGILGIILLLVVLFQAGNGLRKYYLSKDGLRGVMYHGKLGLGIYYFALLVAILGCYEAFEEEYGSAVVLMFLIIGLGIAVGYVHWPSKKAASVPKTPMGDYQRM